MESVIAVHRGPQDRNRDMQLPHPQPTSQTVTIRPNARSITFRYLCIIIAGCLISLPNYSIAQDTKSNDKIAQCCYPIISELTNRIGLIDSRGKLITSAKSESEPLELESVLHGIYFSEGLTATASGRDSQGYRTYGYMNQAGETIISPQYSHASAFSEGVASVSKGGRYFFIDKTGKEIFNTTFAWAGDFHEGLARVQQENGSNTGFINKAGELVIQPRFHRPGDFSEGLSAVLMENRKLGFIDKQGELIITTKFPVLASDNGIFSWNSFGIFSDGLFPVKIHEKWGYIDTKGEIRIPPRFDVADSFYQGLARVRIGRRVGFINKNGIFVIPPRFGNATSFSRGLARVTFKETETDITPRCYDPETGNQLDPGGSTTKLSYDYGYITKTGQVVFRGRYVFVHEEMDGGAEDNSFQSTVDITFESSPEGAKIYLIPSARLVLDKALLRDENKLSFFLLPVETPETYPVPQNNYLVILEHQGKREQRWVDAHQDSKAKKDIRVKIAFKSQ